MTDDILMCPCQSGLEYKDCCEPFMSLVSFSARDENLGQDAVDSETVLVDWTNRYGPATSKGFYEKARPYVFRISRYLDDVVDMYIGIEFPGTASDYKKARDSFLALKHNILLSNVASLECLSEGLFIQSGILLRSAIEDCFVMLDVCLSSGQIERFLQDRYRASAALARIKRYVPSVLANWYGYFSANFTHAGPLHQAPYIPRACYPENWVLVTGLQNLVRSVVAYHIVLERAHLSGVKDPWFWEIQGSEVSFDENSIVFEWAAKLGKELVQRFPPDAKRPGFKYSDRSYGLKA